jgi:hypothetical protein
MAGGDTAKALLLPGTPWASTPMDALGLLVGRASMEDRRAIKLPQSSGRLGDASMALQPGSTASCSPCAPAAAVSWRPANGGGDKIYREQGIREFYPGGEYIGTGASLQN